MNTMTTKALKNSNTPIKPVSETSPTPINITPNEGIRLRAASNYHGVDLADVVRTSIIEAIEKLESIDPVLVPCPYCGKSNALEIIKWVNERRDGTEYQGPAVRCNRCDSISSMPSWLRWTLRQQIAPRHPAPADTLL
jgi:hypothetical protein